MNEEPVQHRVLDKLFTILFWMLIAMVVSIAYFLITTMLYFLYSLDPELGQEPLFWIFCFALSLTILRYIASLVKERRIRWPSLVQACEAWGFIVAIVTAKFLAPLIYPHLSFAIILAMAVTLGIIIGVSVYIEKYFRELRAQNTLNS